MQKSVLRISGNQKQTYGVQFRRRYPDWKCESYGKSGTYHANCSVYEKISEGKHTDRYKIEPVHSGH